MSDFFSFLNHLDPALLGGGFVVFVIAFILIFIFRQRAEETKTPEKLKEPPEVLDLEEDLKPTRSEGVVDHEVRLKETFRPEEDHLEGAIEVRPDVQPKSLKDALASTKSGFFGRIKSLFSDGAADSEKLDELEEVLYTSDLGPKTVQRLMSSVEEKVGRITGNKLEEVRMALRDEMITILDTVQTQPLELNHSASGELKVWMIVGVNGAGKTTTIGKLSHKLALSNHKVLIAAGDTFRAAAGEQLKVWSERAQVEIFYPAGVESPSAVAFDACKKAVSGGFSAVIIDTAGRLHTQKPLMDELKKMKRVIEKAIPGAPHEVLLVLDANAGQNALIQAREFNEALGVTGVVLTKMDGTAKGGVAVGVACELNLPVKMIGVGESIEDLRPFSSSEFVDSII